MTHPNKNNFPRAWLFILGVAALAAVSLTTRSFWIDECYSARFAQQPTLHDCWKLLREIQGSDPQMPLYILWIWGCEKFVGSSELALRAVNFFWFIPALVVLVRAFAGNRALQNAVFLCAIGSPFAWYYLNEARAYTMQFGTSLILFALVCHWVRRPETPVAAERGRVAIFCTALVLLGGSSILSMVLAAAPLMLWQLLLPRERRQEFFEKFWPAGIATLAVLLLLGIYYLWTLFSGDRATSIATSDWKNFIFVGYELAGFSGLGPGRLEIRSHGAEVFRPYAAGLLAYALVLAALLGIAAGDLRRRLGGKKAGLALLAVVLPPALLVAASAFRHFRILGRHHAAMLPAVIILFGFCVMAAWRRGRAGKILAVVFFALQLASALSLRFAARHEKDDYRDATAFAKNSLAAGKTVWWDADPNAAAYYQLPLVKNGVAENGRALWIIHANENTFTNLAPADVVVASRRDVYDERGALADFLARENYLAVTNFTAFTVWARGGR